MDGQTIFMIIMAVLLVVLIGVFFYLRKQRSDE
jgi:LPXTG-motif cell wall-anchored protein